MSKPRPAVFFDRDNTLIVGVDYLGDPDEVELMPGAAECVAAVRDAGFATVVVSNQSGVARGKFDEDSVRRVDARMAELLVADNANAMLDLQLFCPHHPDFDRDSDRRKPKPGMLFDARDQLSIDLSASWMVGDAPRDIEAGHAAGCRTILFTPAGLPRSPAADAKSSVEPDHHATSLADVARLIVGR
ncbi:MAG: HAD family hydrolase [Planctomycetota bacterium]